MKAPQNIGVQGTARTMPPMTPGVIPKMKLLVLDIDETLIHATDKIIHDKWDFKVAQYFVYKRPHLDSFLDYCKSNFNVGVWTTAGDDFAASVVKKIFTDDYPLMFVWSVERCTRVFEPELQTFSYIKNLKKLKRKGYKLEDVIMIDDTPSNLRKNYGNLIRIEEYCGQNEDKELLRIMRFLDDLKTETDIRSIEKRSWKSKYKV